MEGHGEGTIATNPWTAL